MLLKIELLDYHFLLQLLGSESPWRLNLQKKFLLLLGPPPVGYKKLQDLGEGPRIPQNVEDSLYAVIYAKVRSKKKSSYLGKMVFEANLQNGLTNFDDTTPKVAHGRSGWIGVPRVSMFLISCGARSLFLKTIGIHCCLKYAKKLEFS